MRAMLLKAVAPLGENQQPLELADLPDPRPCPGEVLIQVRTCGVCHTDLDEIEGRSPPPRLAGSKFKRDTLLGEEGRKDFAGSAVSQSLPRAVIQG